MANEFTGMEIECIPPYLVPPTGDPEYQSCLIQGSRPGQTAVPGEDYISTAYYYTRSHLWRNLGIVIGFWIFFSVLNAIGLELLKPNKGGASVTVFKRGQVSKDVKKNIEKGSVENGDEEKGRMGAVDQGGQAAEEKSEEEAAAEGVEKNETVFTWQDVRYTIPTKGGEKVLLDNVSGYVRPGKLTALMGESGAGKTTLLNALAQRLGSFGTATGTFLVDGSPLPISFQRSTGFAEQQDVHEPNQTVREALQFSALLRQPAETPVKEKYEYVEKILSLLEMQNIAGAMVGEIGSGLNQEQRKRLTIGVELAARPSLLFFLDEPTSGLDSQAAWNVVRFLRKLADAGQAILCTIHQPSAILFEEFDELLLLKAGGMVVYHGELGKDSQTMIGYFERNGAAKCPKVRSPFLVRRIPHTNLPSRARTPQNTCSKPSARATQTANPKTGAISGAPRPNTNRASTKSPTSSPTAALTPPTPIPPLATANSQPPGLSKPSPSSNAPTPPSGARLNTSSASSHSTF